MLVEGACKKGHTLVCVIVERLLRGALVRGGLRRTCPQCGADIAVQLEDGTTLLVRAPSEKRQAG
jgi:hypothetical protein